jgi:hypothetical protein
MAGRILAKLKHSTSKLTSHVLLTEHLQLPAEDPMRQYAHVTIYKQRRFSTIATDASSSYNDYDEEDFIVDNFEQRRATTDVLHPAIKTLSAGDKCVFRFDETLGVQDSTLLKRAADQADRNNDKRQ